MSAALLLTENELIISNENRRDSVTDFLAAVTEKNTCLGVTRKFLNDIRMRNVTFTLERMKIKESEVEEEDIELQNKKNFDRFIMKDCLPTLLSITRDQLVKQIFTQKYLTSQVQLAVMQQELGGGIYPEFLSFVNYFRTRLFQYIMRKDKGGDFTSEDLTGLTTRITRVKDDFSFRPQISDMKYPEKYSIEYKGHQMTMLLHKKFDDYSRKEGKLFENLFNILKNTQIKARKQTDTGFMMMFQSILVLQGANVNMKMGIETKKYIFESDQSDDVPLGLQRVQNAMVECEGEDLFLQLISLAYEELGGKNDYFQQILYEGLRLGIALCSYGNLHVQTKFLHRFRKALKNSTSAQYLFQGIKKILRFSAKKFYLAKGKKKILHNLMMATCILLQNLCEGHNRDMKNFLRSQNLSIANVNLVTEVAKLLETIIERFNEGIVYIDEESAPSLFETMQFPYDSNPDRNKKLIDFLSTLKLPEARDVKLVIQGFRSLNEFVQGPIFENQVVLVEYKGLTTKITQLLGFIGCYFWRGTVNGSIFEGDNKEDLFNLLLRYRKKDSSDRIELSMLYHHLQAWQQSQSARSMSKRDMASLMSGKTKELPETLGNKKDIFLRNSSNIDQKIIKTKMQYDRTLLGLEQNILTFLTSLIEGRILA